MKRRAISAPVPPLPLPPPLPPPEAFLPDRLQQGRRRQRMLRSAREGGVEGEWEGARGMLPWVGMWAAGVVVVVAAAGVVAGVGAPAACQRRM